ncbi:SF1B family DNA helicase RecD2 [Sporosarcina aquimarina]|uniref:ATP-dependent RecD2 DNA helicase n=1 Tax=Sporosarcina aquimarina TaxID=114975 RepID=A0ABU4FWD9_9BACL|nr:ATP-dependent RecD-like DNA helicase [Sporosarcina aquimarina]MDW0109026.1 ATP-dependent RecD-like DNA helicase [Sporosarcina aquimarina]
MEKTDSAVQEEPFLIGRAVVTIFHNPDNLFTIAKLKVRKTNCSFEGKEIVVKGSFPKLADEEEYRFTGRLINHATYGQQFDVKTFQKELPATETGLIHYLSGDMFPGIGRKTAETIINHLGSEAIRKIMENEDVLDEIPRLNSEKKETLVSVLRDNLGLERTIVKLNEWGFGPQIAMRIYQTYREDTIEKLTENPYRLIEDVEGVGFQRADDLGRQLGITGTHTSRIQAAILHTISNGILSSGHVYLEAVQVLPEVKRLLESSQPEEIAFKLISTAIIELVDESRLSAEQRRLYLPSLYFSELGIAAKMERILDQDRENTFPSSEIRKAIGETEDRFDVSYAETQIDAIEKALNSPAMILTGGPGTGKTTVVRGLVEVYAELHGLTLDPKEYAKKEEPFPIILAAPTGRAAKRLSESTGLPAMTIHRLLGFTGQEKEEETEREIKARLIIIDEASMLDTWLAHQLLKAIDDDAQVLFVGDQDQLPSVGPGQVLRDFLESGTIPVVELTEIYRQSAGSTIIELAHAIKRSEPLGDLALKTSDRSFIRTDADQVTAVVSQIVKNALVKGQAIKDIQVLAPMYKGPAGIDALNGMIQEMVNPAAPGRKEVTFGDVVYRIGDRVLQLVNQPESNVFNGDMGEVISILKAKETIEKKDLMVVSFDGIEVTYERSDLNQLTLAYCCSIHKSQGSEFPTVIMPVVRSHRKMLRRNLLYTGITRAKNFLILCGSPTEFNDGIARMDERERQTTLKQRLRGESPEVIVEKTNDEVDSTVTVEVSTESDQSRQTTKQLPQILSMETVLEVDPMVGMNGETPYDFMQSVD